MFSGETDILPERARHVADRLWGALELARELLTLDDDYDVEWDLPAEFEQRAAESLRSSRWLTRRRPRRPERSPSRPLPRIRRAGAPTAAPHACLTPVEPRAPDRGHELRGH